MSLLYLVICLIIGLIPVFFLFKKDRKKHIPVKWLPALLRFLTLFFTAALLLAPAFPSHRIVEEKPIVLWLQDASSSMEKSLGKDSQSYRKKVLSLWNKKAQPFRTIPLSFGIKLSNKVDFQYKQQGTNLSNALQKAVQRYQNQNIGAIVVVSDGNYNLGSNPLYALQDDNLPIYTVAVGDSTTPRDLQISFSQTNKTVSLGNQFELIANLKAERLNGRSGEIKILHQGQNIAQQHFDIQSNSYSHTFRFYLPAKQKGLQKFTISVPPLEGEQNTGNNQKDFFVKVLEKDIKILIAANAPHPDIEAIKVALENHPEYKISIKYGSDLPQQISDADLLICHDLPNNNGTLIPKHGNIPVWYILGPNTNINLFSKEQKLLNIQAGSGYNNALPRLNPAFNLFVLPENILEVTEQMPPLLSPNGNYHVLQGQILLYQDKKNTPLWLFQPGRSPEAVLCGTGLWRWRLYSFKSFKQSKTIDDLIQKTITLLTSNYDNKPFHISVEKYQYQEQEPISVNAFLRDATGALVNTSSAKLWISDSSGRKKEFTFNKAGKSYQYSINGLPTGLYSIKGEVNFNGKTLRDSASFTVSKTSLEELKSNADFAILYKLAKNTNGQFYTLANIDELPKALEKNPGIKPIIRQETHYIKWIDWKWYFLIILITVTAEWLLRKYWGL